MTPKNINQLIEEYEQLTYRIVKLGKFSTTELYYSLGSDEKHDLIDQLAYMRKYHRILVRRIRRLEILT